jgi:hypothetical protein
MLTTTYGIKTDKSQEFMTSEHCLQTNGVYASHAHDQTLANT